MGDVLLDKARLGDEQAFTRLIEPLQRELHAHCYRMLGSTYDADDALQDTLVKAWRKLGSFDVLTLRDDRIAAITTFIGPQHFRQFGLPPSLP